MVTTPESSKRTQKPTTRNRLIFLLITLLLLAGAAVYTWTLPGRREKMLQNTPLAQLNTMAKQNPNDPRLFYYIGKRLEAEGRLVPARTAFQHAAEMDVDDEEAWLAWAAAEQRLKHEPEAFTTLNVFLKQHPNSVTAHKALATFYYTQENYIRSREEALVAAKLDPRDTSAWRMAGVSALQLETYPDAEAAFTKAIALDPKDARALIGMGDALDKEERRRDALEWYRKAHEAAPGEANATLPVGRILFQMATKPADVAAARAMLELANQQDPTGRALIWLGRAYAREKQWDKARDTLEKAKALFPNDAEVAYELQPVYIHFGDKKRADAEGKRHDVLYAYSLEVYNVSTRLHEAKGDAEIKLRLQLCRLYASHNDYAKAAQEYRRLIRRAPGLGVAQAEYVDVQRKQAASPPAPSAGTAREGTPPANDPSVAAQIQQGEALLDQKRFAEAQTLFLSAVRKNAKDAQALQGLGLALDGQGNTGDAFSAFSEALKLDPTLSKSQFSLARLYYRSGLVDVATKRLEKLVQQDPSDPETLYALGVCYLNTVHAPQAEQMFARAAAIKPDNADYWTQLANAEVQDEKPSVAEQHYRRALQVTPTDVEAKAGLAKLLLKEQATPARQQEAEQLFRAVLATDSLNEDALLGLGHLLVDKNQPQEAVTHLETLINHNSNVAEAYFQLAKAYDRLDNKYRADYCRKVFKTVSEFETERDNTLEQARIHLKDPALRLKLARLYAKSGQYPQALNQYQMCLHLDAKNTAAKKELAALTDRLKTSGQLTSAVTFNNMVSASLHKK